MKKIHSYALFSLLVLSTFVVAAPSSHADDCQPLLKLKYPDVAIYEATSIAEPVPHCKAKGLIGGNINFSVWLPTAWNGRFVMGGAGGFVRPEDNQALRLIGPSVLAAGYATASTDTGHQSDGLSNEWGLNDYESIVNYAYLALHRAVVSSKALISDHYGRPADKSFFFGCSNGGRQALHEAQRYPSDFDGIVAGAPALNFSGVTAAFLAITQKMYPDPYNLETALVTPTDRQFLRAKLLAACDDLDGLSDGILHDPRACEFEPTELTCTQGQEDKCLSVEKVAAIKTVYDGPSNDQGALFFGFPYGAEDIEQNGWGSWLTGGAAQGLPNAAYAFGTGIMRNFVHHDADWTHDTTDWNAYPNTIRAVANLLDARSPDLSEFRAQGGKLLMYHGWADVALSAHMSTDYIEKVYATDTTARNDARLFMMPGVLHCTGGPGPSVVNWLAALESWHATGKAPDQLDASYPDKGGSRRICAWPLQAVYQGGDPESPVSFNCQ
ncbi:MAG: tannase/feruloyl esterase family alpha/beta hydrolase [Pseudomonadales bacterium]|nr:tannase/feruloyl esterase family alpha/beta hydrolase [Pseudomonadales bacterium]